MDEWIDYYDSTHTIYASKLHRDLHFQVIARDIIGYISSPGAVVLDYACGEALSAGPCARACPTARPAALFADQITQHGSRRGTLGHNIDSIGTTLDPITAPG